MRVLLRQFRSARAWALAITTCTVLTVVMAQRAEAYFCAWCPPNFCPNPNGSGCTLEGGQY